MGDVGVGALIILILLLIILSPFVMMWAWNTGVVPHIGGTWPIKSYWNALAMSLFIMGLKNYISSK